MELSEFDEQDQNVKLKNDAEKYKRATAERMRRIQKNKIVTDTLLISNYGRPLDTTMDYSRATIASRILKPFTDRCLYAMYEILPNDTVYCIRVSTTQQEMIIVPEEKFISVAFHKVSPAPELYPKIQEKKVGKKD